VKNDWEMPGILKPFLTDVLETVLVVVFAFVQYVI